MSKIIFTPQEEDIFPLNLMTKKYEALHLCEDINISTNISENRCSVFDMS